MMNDFKTYLLLALLLVPLACAQKPMTSKSAPSESLQSREPNQASCPSCAQIEKDRERLILFRDSRKLNPDPLDVETEADKITFVKEASRIFREHATLENIQSDEALLALLQLWGVAVEFDLDGAIPEISASRLKPFEQRIFSMLMRFQKEGRLDKKTAEQIQSSFALSLESSNG